MKIVVTDGYTLNPGDLDWELFREFEDMQYYDRTSPNEVMERCREAEVIITNKTPVNEAVIQSASKLKLIAVTATGYNVVDIGAAKKKNVLVCNVPEYGTYSVAQHTFALLLELSNKVGIHVQSVNAGEWVRSIDWSYTKGSVIELNDKTLGIVGLGKIGRQTAAIAQVFGMKIIHYGGSAQNINAQPVTLKQLFSDSDFISLHCPLKADNHSFVNKQLLECMKPTAFLINTSRGQLIQETDLANALRQGVLAGAALDVLSKEPPPADHPLLHLPNCILTPHIAWVSFEARQRILHKTFENIKAALSGKPQNIV
jgi:glycerate dehydrogenase